MIEGDKLKAITHAVGHAPSAGGLKAYSAYIVFDGITKKALADIAMNQDFIIEAPVVLAYCANLTKGRIKYAQRGELYAIQDATIACTYAMLAAQSLGLSSCWVSAFDEEAVRKALGLRTGLEPVALLPIGYKKVER